MLRLIENNSDFLKCIQWETNSAAYFAHGLATELKEPVALVCTSGTAASNYLPGVTESFYSNTPLIVITADRHPMYLNNNRDDQTVPQAKIFDGVVKKKFLCLPVKHPRFEWFTEKEIKSTIMEATHGTPGPVHINIPVLTFEGQTPEDEDFKLLNLQRVKRVHPLDGEKEWQAYYNVLKSSKRIAVLMGQNQKLTSAQKQKVYDFAQKFNAVILTEHIAKYSRGT